MCIQRAIGIADASLGSGGTTTNMEGAPLGTHFAVFTRHRFDKVHFDFECHIADAFGEHRHHRHCHSGIE